MATNPPAQTEPLVIDLKDDSTKEHKTEHYRRLLESCPVHFNTDLGEYLVARHADVVDILKNPRVYRNERASPESPMATTPVLPTADEPEHTVQRVLVQRAFTQGSVRKLEETVRSIAHQIVDGFVDRGECNLVKSFAYPLPMEVLCLLFGVKYGERNADFRQWAIDILAMTTHREAAAEQALKSFDHFTHYILDKAETRKAMIERGEESPDDLMGALVSPGKNGETLPQHIFVVASAMLLIGGHESTQNMIANSVYLLLRHPGQLRDLKENPELIGNAIEEVVRFESPIQGAWRRPVEDSTVADHPIPAESRMFLLYGSANRDPNVFTRPNEFDIHRDREELREHLGFGKGIHFCLGAHLARMEGRIALEVLLERLPNLRLDDSRPRKRSGTHFMNGFSDLPVRWDAPA